MDGSQSCNSTPSARFTGTSPISKSGNGGGMKHHPECGLLFSSKTLFPFPHSCSSEWGKDGMGVTMIFKQPLVDFKQPLVDFKQPLVDFKQPLVDFKQPLVDFKQPLVDFKQSLVDFKQPLVDFKQPLGDWKQQVEPRFFGKNGVLGL
jgi:hypothetical protein